MDRNVVLLQGKIGNDYKYLKTKRGSEFATFTLCLEAFDKEERDKTENRNTVYIRIMVFDDLLVQYLHKVGARSGNKASIYGRVNSHRVTSKNVTFVQNDIIVRDIHIVKTQSDKDIIENGEAYIDDEENTKALYEDNDFSIVEE